MQKASAESKAFFKGAAWIAVGGFVSKVIGALYRVPLTNLIGGYGMGLYQLVYPLYTLLLTVSATGIPSAIARLIAERVGAGTALRPVFGSAMRLFALIGLVGTLLMAALALPLSYAQGAQEVAGGYLTLAPSVFLVSALSVYRGYMQGKGDMFPTALSEILEQVVKVGIGLPFAYLFRGEPQKAVAFLLLAVSIAEAVALLFAFFYARKKHPLEGAAQEKLGAKRILRTSLPVTANAALLPLSHLVDSVLVVRLLLRHTQDAVGLYGLMTGGALALINLPVSVCYGIAVASIPALASAKTFREKGKKMKFALLTTLAVSVPCALGLFLLAGTAQKLVFPSLGGEGTILIRLTRLLAVSTITLSCTQTLSACLTAAGKPMKATVSMAVAVSVKTVLCLLWVGDPRFSIYGAAMATNISYTLAFLLDLYYNIKVLKSGGTAKAKMPSQRSGYDSRCRFGCTRRGFDRSGQTSDRRRRAKRGRALPHGKDPLV